MTGSTGILQFNQFLKYNLKNSKNPKKIINLTSVYSEVGSKVKKIHKKKFQKFRYQHEKLKQMKNFPTNIHERKYSVSFFMLVVQICLCHCCIVHYRRFIASRLQDISHEKNFKSKLQNIFFFVPPFRSKVRRKR